MDSFQAQSIRDLAEPSRLAEAARGRRHRRVPMRLPMKFKLPDGKARQGVLANLSVSGAGVIARPGALNGDKVELVVPDLGRFTGTVVRLNPRGFGVELSGTRADRIARADALQIFLNRPSENSRAVRYPLAEEAVLETVTGQVAHCLILDVSETGASVATALYPRIGETVMIGRKRGIVARHHEEGLGITFMLPMGAR
ncbi:PilZ domain-containing protein [Parvularcula lutaonensis]|uniref:PilZ domain-containing protein n=1 Tax=Parvularcula lutaonensis TaxID=491923 RepID=A0ABV7MAI4_9PROT|nr:PilZ domain-containing protein [Parvularcula lutaonensis]GGY44627.1 hypothetical protein GCM10007148_11920 [Parvularcula lutaonensis]